MVFGTPGGDQQDQWTLQFFVNDVDFGMNLQEAIDKPTFHSLHFPSSFYPHDAKAGWSWWRGGFRRRRARSWRHAATKCRWRERGRTAR
jgi:gamma-glutamyltranspeptidase/glutathione hydrolase